MEQVRYEYFGTLDLLDRGQVSFVIAQVTVRYLAPARMGQVLDLGARVTGFGRTSFTMSFEVDAGEQALATAEAVLVWVGADLRPVPVPDRVREVIGAFEGLG